MGRFGTFIGHLIANSLGILWGFCDCLQLGNERVIPSRFLKTALLNIKIGAHKKVLNILFEICETNLRALFVAYTILSMVLCSLFPGPHILYVAYTIYGSL